MRRFQKIKTKETHHYGHWYQVDVDDVVLPSGKNGTYNVVRMPIFVSIIPVDKEGNIYFVKQHRYPIDQFSIELPMGHSEGQELSVAAKRELLEETGLTSEYWVELGHFYEANGIGEIPGAILLAKNVVKTNEPIEMDDESITEVIKLSPSEVRRMIGEGVITDSATICTFVKADYSGLLD